MWEKPKEWDWAITTEEYDQGRSEEPFSRDLMNLTYLDGTGTVPDPGRAEGWNLAGKLFAQRRGSEHETGNFSCHGAGAGGSTTSEGGFG